MDNVQEQLDMDLMAEVELSRLKRQYRIMEGDRQAFYEETMSKLKKQRKRIESMRNEKNNLTTDIQAATSLNQKRKDYKIAIRLTSLLDRYKKTVQAIQDERVRLVEINHQIEKTEKALTILHLKQIPDNHYKEKLELAKKAIEVLENRLETIVKRFCTVLTENKAMREEIDHLLKERTAFNITWEKLLQELNVGKKFLLDLVEQATLAYDQREEWCSKLQALKIRAHNDILTHTQDMREVHRQLDHDGKLKDFLLIKGQKRVMKDLEAKELRRREANKEDVKKQIEIYEITLEKIKKCCEANDVDKISAKFLKQEEENFALFNYVNELNHELEMINVSIDELAEKIDDQKILSEKRAEDQQDTLSTLNQALEVAVNQRNADREALDCTNLVFHQVLNGIDEIFHLLKCEWAPILNLIDFEAKEITTI